MINSIIFTVRVETPRASALRNTIEDQILHEPEEEKKYTID